MRDENEPELTAELRQRLLDSIREGLHVSTTLDLLGVEWAAVSSWISRDCAGEPGPWAGIYADMRRAMAEHEQMLVRAANAALADPKNARFALQYLRARYPDRWDISQGQSMRVLATERVLDTLRSRLTAVEYARIVDALQGQPAAVPQPQQAPVTH